MSSLPAAPPPAPVRPHVAQTCNEFGFYQTCEVGSGCFFTQGLVLLPDEMGFCQELYQISPATVAANVAASNKFYGGARPDLLSPPATRVLYPNGNVDPCASPPPNTRRRPSGDETRRACGSGGPYCPPCCGSRLLGRPPVSGQGTGSRSSPRPRRSCPCSAVLQTHRPDSLGQPCPPAQALPVS